ncbi:solute carrier family 45 member 3 [Aplochiton taeniatus]
MPDRVPQLLLVNVLTCGMEVCMAAGTVCMPPLLLKAGMEERYMTMVLGVGPILGLIAVPIIGSASDAWHGRFGRRRPFIWLLCAGFLLGLLVMPRARLLAGLLSQQNPRWMEAVLQAGAICLLEFCGQACFTPLEALLSDLFPGEEESRRAFSVFSFMISLGGCLGYLLPAVDWSHSRLGVLLGGQEAFVYALLTLLFLSCLLSTAFISEERGSRRPGTAGATALDATSEPSHWTSRFCGPVLLPRQWACVVIGRCVSTCVAVLPRLHAACACVPAVMRRLFAADLCTWMALMSFMLFYTEYMGKGLYHGVPSATPGSPERLRYDKGVRVASLGLFLQCVMSVVWSTFMERWVALLGAKAVYLSAVALLALATAVMSVSDSVLTVTVVAAVTGYTFCVLQVVPYTLLCLYHSDREVFFPSSTPRPFQLVKCHDVIDSKSLPPLDSGRLDGKGLPGRVSLPGPANPPACPLSTRVSLPLDRDAGVGAPGAIPQRGMCFDMAILDSGYLLSQVLPALCLGFIVEQAGSVRVYMVSACFFSLLALCCSSGVVFTHRDLHWLKSHSPHVV